MATQVTKVCSPSRNWKKYWRYASSPRNFCPKTSIKVSPITGPNLRPNESPDIKRIDTSYQGSGLVCRNFPIIPEDCGVAVRKKIFNYRQTLRGLTQRAELADTVPPELNASEEPNIVCRKRPAESSPSSVLNIRRSQSPTHQSSKVIKLRQDSNKIPTIINQSAARTQREQKSAKHIISTASKLEENFYNSEYRKRRTEASPPSVLTYTGLDSSQKPKLKIGRLQNSAEKRQKQKTSTEAQITERTNETRNLVSYGFTNTLDNEESRQLSDKETLGPSRKCTPRFHGAQWPKYRNEYNSLRPSLSDIELPLITSDNTIKLNKDGNDELVVLGKGAYGLVTQGELGIGNQKYDCVLKTLRPSRSSRKMVLREARVLHYLASTESVPKLFGLLESKDPSKLPVIVQECFAGGQDFYNLIDKHHTSKRDWVKICLNAAEGLLRIHAKQIIINDIKPDNILVDINNRIRFIDFGMATLNEGIFYPLGPDVERCFQIAPECRKGAKTNYRSDIFSFGFVLKSIGDEADVPELTKLSKLLTCADPFQRITIFDAIQRLKELENNI